MHRYSIKSLQFHRLHQAIRYLLALLLHLLRFLKHQLEKLSRFLGTIQ